MAYDGQVVTDLDITRPDGDAEPKSILDDVTKEIKRAIRQTQYSWSSFHNLTDVQLNVGAVVSLGPNGLLVSDVTGSFLKYVVAVEIIVPNAIGMVAREGPVAVLTAGSITSLNYVRKSSTPFAVEDMGVACTPTNVIPNSAIGFSLADASGGALCDIFLFEQTSMFPTALANHVLSLTNQTGNILQPGESVTTDSTNDLSVTNNDQAGSFEPTLVAFETIPNITAGRFIHSGVTPVKVVGNVSRNHYLRKSATAKSLETTGLSTHDIVSPPPGTVGVALTAFSGGGTGTISALMLGSTVTMPAMSGPMIANLIGGNNATFPGQVMDLSAHRVTLINPTNNATVTVAGSVLSCNINFQGRGGRDQAAGFNPSAWINFFYTWNGLTCSTRMSVNSPQQGPNLADGETHFAYASTVKLNQSSAFESVYINGDLITYGGARPVLENGQGFSEVQIFSLGTYVPPNAQEYSINVWGTTDVLPPNTASIHEFEVRIFPGAGYLRSRAFINASSPSLPLQSGSQISINATVPYTGYLSYLWSVPFGHFPQNYGAYIDILSYRVKS